MTGLRRFPLPLTLAGRPLRCAPRQSPGRTVGLVAALAFGCIVAATNARADCVDGTREMTAAERDFYARAMAALAASIPPAPANMALRGKPFDFRQPTSMPSFCRGQREGDFDVAVSAAYLFTWPKQEADRMGAERRQLLDQIKALETLPPDQAAQYQSLVEQSRAAYNSQPKAKRGGPPLSDAERALAEQKAAEGKALDDKAKAIERAHLAGVKPQADALRVKADALQTYPQELQINLGMNRRTLPQPDERTLAATSGAASPGRSAGLKVTNVALAVTGPAGMPRQALFDAVDRSRLQALVGKPLPTVAESEALAAAAAARSPAAAVGSATGDPNAAAAVAPGAATPSSNRPAPPQAPASPAKTADAPATAPPALPNPVRKKRRSAHRTPPMP